MGNKTNGLQSDLEVTNVLKKFPDEVTVTIERSLNSTISKAGEGLFVLPKSTTAINITDMIYFTIREQINLYFEGENVTRVYNTLENFKSKMNPSDGILRFVYDSVDVRNSNQSIVVDNYINPISLESSIEIGFIGLKILPRLNCKIPPLKKPKLKVFEDCSGAQLSLILKRMLGIPKENNLWVYKTDGKMINYYDKITSLKGLIGPDNLIHLRYGDL